MLCNRFREALKVLLGTRLLMRFAENRSFSWSKKKRVSPGQQQLLFAFYLRLNQIPDNCHQIAVRFRQANGIHDEDRERSVW
jgi:hypothetical protein